MPERFRRSGRNSLWGSGYLELPVRKNNFLRQLNEFIDPEKPTKELADCYKDRAEYGPISSHPAVLFKMLLLAYLHKMSERDMG